MLLSIGTVFSEKFCVNRKFYIKSNLCNDYFGKCYLFSVKNENELQYLVSGKSKTEYIFCLFARNDESRCGKSGMQYIEKDKFFPKLKNDICPNKNDNLY